MKPGAQMSIRRSGGLALGQLLVAALNSAGSMLAGTCLQNVRVPTTRARSQSLIGNERLCLWQRHMTLGANGLALKARYKPHVGLCDGPTAQIGLATESYGVAIGYNVVEPLALISLRTPFQKMWVMERQDCRTPGRWRDRRNPIRLRNRCLNEQYWAGRQRQHSRRVRSPESQSRALSAIRTSIDPRTPFS